MASEKSRMNFEPVRYSVDRSTSLERKVICYKTSTVSEPIYEDDLAKNMTMETCYEAANTNPNSIYNPINACLKEYNKYELCTYISSGSSVYLRKRSIFPEFPS